MTKTWGDSDVINSNKSSVVGLCFDQQLRMRSKSVNIMNKYLLLLSLLVFLPLSLFFIHLERFVPLHRLREPGPAASTAGTVEHQLLLWWPWTQVHLQRAWLTDTKTNVMLFYCVICENSSTYVTLTRKHLWHLQNYCFPENWSWSLEF